MVPKKKFNSSSYSFCEEILPIEKSSNRNHNIFFTSLTSFVKRVSNKQKTNDKIQNSDINDFITSETFLSPIIKKIESFQANNSHLFTNSFNLKKIFLHTCGRGIVLGLLNKTINVVIGYLSIILLDNIIDELKNYESTNQSSLIIKMFIFVASFLVKELFMSQYYWIRAKWQVDTKTSFQYLIFKKTLTSQMITKNDSLNTEDKATQQPQIPNANNVLTVDVETTLFLFWGAIELVTSVLELVFSLCIIYWQLGETTLKGMIFLGIIFLFIFLISSIHFVLVERKMSEMDKRVTLSKDVIEGMKSIKYLGWESIFKNQIEKKRSNEFKYLFIIKLLDSIFSIFWNCIHYVFLYYFLSEFVESGNDLKPINVFTLIALFSKMIAPIALIPWSIREINLFKVSFNRIEAFLNQLEINHSFITSPIQHPSQIQPAVVIKNQKFQWPTSSPQRKSQEQNPPATKIFEKQKYGQLEDFQVELSEFEPKQQSEAFVLDIPEIKINQGELVVVIGKIGSGKTALLNAILNQLQPVDTRENSQLYLNGSTAFVSQNHWLQNKTVKDNILFGEDYDSNWYDTVIHTSDLAVDFKTFSKGDQKLVGPGGGNLSGGQKQRIALGRAIYSNKDIYLLDDIFSSLDAHVAEKIYKQLVLELLINKMKKTVILITSHFEILRKREQINQIILIEQGKIVNSQLKIERFIDYGLQQELSEEQQKQLKKQLLEGEDEKKQQQQQKLKEEAEEELVLNCFENSESCNNLNVMKQQQPTNENHNQNYLIGTHQDNQQDDNDQIQDQEEERETGEIKTQTLKAFLDSMGIAFFTIYVMSNFLMEGSQLLIDFWLRDSNHPNNSFFKQINETFNSFSTTLLILTCLTTSLTFLKGIMSSICSLMSGKRLFKKLNDKIIFSKMRFFDKNPTGRIINRVSEDICNIDSQLSWTLQQFFDNIGYIVGYPLGILLQFPQMIILMLLAGMMMHFFSKLFRSANREIKRLDSVNSGVLLSFISEACSGVQIIRSFNKEKYMMRQFLLKLKDSVNCFLITETISVWMNMRIALISNFIFLCLVLCISVVMIFNIQIDYNAIAMTLTYSLLLSERFQGILYHFCVTEKSMISVERCRQYFDNEQEDLETISNCNNNLLINSRQKKDERECTIEFENVYITYDFVSSDQILSKNSKDIQFALKNVSFKIYKGEKIAICGRTGSGKTSILNTLFGMYPIQFGSIYAHGKNISTYSLRQLRQQMSIIPQFGFLYHETLLKNLDPQNCISREEIQHKIEATKLKIRSKQNKSVRESKIENETVVEMIDQEQQQYQSDLDFEISDGGSNLSNGEKQIINFLRVILRETDIVCLDEASSNMDPQTDQQLHEQIFKFTQDKTLLVITHRLENIDLFDKVVVLEEGRIVECGHVQELRQIKNGFFNKLLLKNYKLN